MIPTTQALIICVILICGLEETVLSQRMHCAGKQCVVPLQEPDDFPGAQKRCKDWGGQLLMVSSEQAVKTLTSPLNGLSGSYWLKLHSTGRTIAEAAADLQNCSSISVSMGGNLTVLWKLCSDKLDGFLCQYTLENLCIRLPARGAARVRYIMPMGFEVNDSEIFLQGTVAVEEKVGSKYPDSKHVCFSGKWVQAPWNCEVLHGGCDYNCNSTTHTCICPAGKTLHSNIINCTKDLCADCAQECQQEGDSYICKCKKGYRLAQDRKSCVDLKCKEEDLCTGKGEECSNTQRGFECICEDGFVKEDGVCVDVAICDKCEHMLCEKPDGVYKCACRNGFRVSAKDPTKCEQYCTKSDCPAECIPNPDVKEKDMHQCFCPEGYIKDMRNGTAFCTDINECENEKQCDQKCENLFGSYRCLCNEGFKLHDGYMCVPVKEEQEDRSGSTPPYPTPFSVYPAAMPSYIKTGSVLGLTVFMVLCVALLYFLVRNMVKRCGKFELPSFRHPDIDIFYLQQVTTETYKRLSFDKQFKNDMQRL
ncbi:thrombomodulin-like [Xiphias gladius]|uniref:thrombomodulin-like n=1 Tax=Xiphias gladius TaxID=8245 RepID=UPI001A9A1882|nr:thrombomodulin-like [Xiphias gladius]